MTRRGGDRGSILVLTLVLCVVLGVGAVALGRYVQSATTSSTSALQRTQRIAAADGALRLGIEQLKLSTANCTSTMTVPAINGATVTLSCANSATGVSWTQHTLTATVSLGSGVTVGRARVQVTSAGGSPCTSSCTVTINSFSPSVG